MELELSEEKAKKIIFKRCTQVSSIDELAEGDKVVMGVGTWCCGHPNNDWRWIQGYVIAKKPTKISDPTTSEEIAYNIFEISPFKNRLLRRLFPEVLVIDINQPFHNPNPLPSPITYGSIYRYN